MTNTVSVIPDVIDALVALAKANVTTVTVYDGVGNSDDPGDYLMIGVSDPDGASDRDRAATSTTDWANVNYTAAAESGEVMCAALSWTGDTSQAGVKAARDGVYTVIETFGTALRANPSLSLSNVLWTRLGKTHELTQLQSQEGVLALALFSIHFEARV